MAMVFNALLNEFDGFALELFQTGIGLSTPTWNLLETQVFANRLVSFDRDIQMVETFAVRLQDNSGNLILRSGRRDQSSGLLDASSNNFSVLLYVERGDTITITPDQVKGMVERPPILVTEEDDEDDVAKMLITSLGLAIKGDHLILYGDGVVFELPVGGPIRFEHEFYLKPETDPVDTDRILVAETISTIVRSSSGGILGFLTNLVNQVIINSVLDDFVAAFEKEIQNAMDSSLSDQTAAQNAPEGTIISIHSVTIDGGNGIIVRPFGLVMNDGGDICASSLTAGSVRRRPARQVDQLRTVRDKALKDTLQGEAYIQAFYDNNPELVSILLTQPEILKQVDRVLNDWLGEIDSQAPGQSMMSPEVAKQWITLLEMVEKTASPNLATIVNNVVPEVETFVGRPMSEVLAESEKLRRS